MKSGGPLRRTTPLQVEPGKVRDWERRSRKALPAQSEKRKAEKPRRDEVRRIVFERDGGCQARGILPGRCWRVMDAHEVQSRGRRPGGHLDPENVITLCRGHHEWVTNHSEEAEALGFLLPSSK